MEMDGGLLLVSYFLGMYLLYARNIGG